MESSNEAIMEMDRPVNDESYSNSIILNNLGCVLLQSGAYRDAFTTFRDAVDTLQASSRAVAQHEAESTTACTANDNGRSKIRVALRKFRATERLHQSLDVSVVGYEDDSIQNLVFETSFGRSMHVVVTLRPVGDEEEEDTRDYDVDSSIMLHNFALAHIILAKHGLLQDKEAHKSALYIFRVAFRILFQKLEEMIDGDGYVIENDATNFDNFSGVVTVVLANLVYTLHHQGFQRAARDGFLQLQEFFQTFSQNSNVTLLGAATAAPAA